MQRTILITLILISSMSSKAQENNRQSVVKNGMKVNWYFENDSIFFEMSSPTKGWLTIGFNTTSGTKGAYLLMGNCVNGVPKVVEHYTLAPGNYKKLSDLGAAAQVKNVSGEENSKGTRLAFSLPVEPTNKYQKELKKGMKYTLIIAYSQEDDFQHHSIMRTSIQINL